MIEYSATPEVRNAMARAHEERGLALKAVVAWLFGTGRGHRTAAGVSRWA